MSPGREGANSARLLSSWRATIKRIAPNHLADSKLDGIPSALIGAMLSEPKGPTHPASQSASLS